MAVEWSDGIPFDVMTRIFDFMETFDQARFACVCPRWLEVAREATRRRRHPPLPWLMLPPFRDGSGGDGCCTFFGFPAAGVSGSMRTCSIRLPQFIWRSCIGSSPDGWLVVLGKNRELCAVNPLTRALLSLPRLMTIPGIALKLRFRPTPMEYSIFLYHFFSKAIVADVPGHGLLVAAAVNRHFHWLVVAKVGERVWTTMTKPFLPCDDDQVDDIALYGTTIYGVTRDGRLLTCDLAFLSPDSVPVTKTYKLLDRPGLILSQQLVTFLRPTPTSTSSSSPMRSHASPLIAFRYRLPVPDGGDDDVSSEVIIRFMRLYQVSDVAFRCVGDVYDFGGQGVFIDDRCTCVAIPTTDVWRDHVFRAVLRDRICTMEVFNLAARRFVGSHRLAGVERSNHPPPIWFWPNPGFSS